MFHVNGAAAETNPSPSLQSLATDLASLIASKISFCVVFSTAANEDELKEEVLG